MSVSIAKADCGCGGHGGGECSCGGGMAVCTDMNFKRPRFFAGQLLTEDDLQSLTDYVVAKNRLHNRFLFGEGVVCGLTVTCHPCGKGKVVVAPGFALDCRGNDILVSCKEELDVKALIRDLRKRQLAGYDCGDPCDEKNPDRTYGLYLTYIETLEDPVAPYASGDPCGQQACEPTRVCEGYRFELRCNCDQPARTDLFKRIAACVGDIRQAASAISNAQTAEAQASQFERAAHAIRADAKVSFEAESVRVLREATPELAKLNEISLKKDLDDDGVPKLRPEERDLRLHVARLQLLTGAVTRFRALSEEDQAAARKANAGLEKLLDEAGVTISAAAPRIEALAAKTLKTSLARTEAEESVRLSKKYVLGNEARYDTVEARMVALNTPASYRQINRIRADASLLKDWLLEKLDHSASLTRCDLADRLCRVRLDAPPSQDEDRDLAEITATGRAVRELVQILFEYLIDCICLALNPPCQPCEDQGVLLACLTVKNCEVIDICNMSRRFVLTPVALRYWLPPIGAVGDLIRQFCCELDIGKLFDRPKYDPVEPRDNVAKLMSLRTEEMAIARTFAPSVSEAAIDGDAAVVLKQFRIAQRDVEAVTAFSSNLALLSARAARIDTGALSVRGRALGDLFAGDARRAPSELAEAKLRERVAEAVGDEVATARENIERRLAESLGRSVDSSVSEMREKLSDSLSKNLTGSLEKRVAEDVTSAVARELTEAKLTRAVQGTDTMKELKEENRRLTREMKKLSDAVDALKKKDGSS